MEERIFVWPPKGDELPEEYVGVMLKRLNPKWVHAGFLYRVKSKGTNILHLSGHRELKQEVPPAGALCIICRVESVRIPAVAALARSLYRLNKAQGIPYAFSSPAQEWFSRDGRLLLGPDRLGLTCSNFVLALYRAAGLPLVQIDTWPARGADVDWQEEVLKAWGPAIKKRRRTRKHFAAVRTEIGRVVRCRPVEVGGAALADETPCDFKTAERHAETVERLLPTAPASPQKQT